MAATKPNILIIWGDDIGWFNVSAYNHGIMGYRTPNIDRIAKEGCLFTDWYGQQSCTAGRAAFITGHSLREGRRRIAEACERGRASVFGSGINPGLADLIAIVSASGCDRIDKVTRENHSRDELRNGAYLRTVYDKYGVL